MAEVTTMTDQQIKTELTKIQRTLQRGGTSKAYQTNATEYVAHMHAEQIKRTFKTLPRTEQSSLIDTLQTIYFEGAKR